MSAAFLPDNRSYFLHKKQNVFVKPRHRRATQKFFFFCNCSDGGRQFLFAVATRWRRHNLAVHGKAIRWANTSLNRLSSDQGSLKGYGNTTQPSLSDSSDGAPRKSKYLKGSLSNGALFWRGGWNIAWCMLLTSDHIHEDSAKFHNLRKTSSLTIVSVSGHSHHPHTHIYRIAFSPHNYEITSCACTASVSAYRCVAHLAVQKVSLKCISPHV